MMKDIPRFVRRFVTNAFDYNRSHENKLYALKVGFTTKQFTQEIDGDIPLTDEDGRKWVRESNHIPIPSDIDSAFCGFVLDIEDWNIFVDDKIKVDFIILYFVDGIYYRNDFEIV